MRDRGSCRPADWVSVGKEKKEAIAWAWGKLALGLILGRYWGLSWLGLVWAVGLLLWASSLGQNLIPKKRHGLEPNKVIKKKYENKIKIKR